MEAQSCRLNNNNLFLRCQCSEPGFCSVFNRTMGMDPPDWNWCQNTTPKEREKYYKLLSRSVPTKNQELLKIFQKIDYAQEWFYLYYLTHSEKYYHCKTALEKQDEINTKIIKLIQSQEKKDVDFNRVQILSLGHSNQQFSTIDNQKYLKKVNLNYIDAGEYSGNEWAEARAFISKKKLFDSNIDFVGFTTASWNDKYQNYAMIDRFHNWQNSKVLLRSQSTDYIVLCADVFCCCWWFGHKFQYGVLTSLFRKRYADYIGRKLLDSIKLNHNIHIKVPYGNQIICHKLIFNEYKEFLENNKVFEKINLTIQKYRSFLNTEIDYIQEKYQHTRIQAFLLEMVTCFWFSNQNYLYIPNTERKENWYSQKDIKERINYNV
jgi:hypothetical protein